MKKILSFIYAQFTKIPVKYRFIAYVVLAFSSFLSFISIDSAWADSWNINGLFIGYSIVSALLVAAITYIAITENKQ
jgi:hypothetical protein